MMCNEVFSKTCHVKLVVLDQQNNASVMVDIENTVSLIENDKT